MNNKMFKPGKMLGALLLVSLVSGCAQPKTLYNWGNYQSQLYARFKADTSPDKQIQDMEKTLQTRKSDQSMAPGFHAHLGLLYGEVGRRADMCEQFKTEKQLFPESAQFMDFLLAKAEPKAGVKADKKDVK
jgi:hypothetical protein